MKTKKGFSAYGEIQELARRAFGPSVSVIAAIVGDDYTIERSGQLIVKGTSESVRDHLLKGLELLDKEVRS